MESTQPIFIIGTGRNGSRTMFRMLSGSKDLEIHHEFCCTHVQKLACLYSMKIVSKEYVKEKLKKIYLSAIKNSESSLWIDSSNKLSWIIEPLIEVFPNAKFLLITRDGRKVTSSFYYKLRDEMYDDRSVSILKKWLDNKKNELIPPPEKKYWWNIPQKNQNFHEEFKDFNRLQRVAYHWYTCNKVVLDSFEKIPKSQQYIVKLEELVKEEKKLKDVIKFLEIKFDHLFVKYLQTPRNVFFPLDFQLTKKQLKQFNEICLPLMIELGYNKDKSYVVKY